MPEEIWRDYHRRADVENRIAELKHDVVADGFCLRPFFATATAFRAVLLLFNLVTEFQRAGGLPGYHAQPPSGLRCCPAVPFWVEPGAVWSSSCRKRGVG